MAVVDLPPPRPVLLLFPVRSAAAQAPANLPELLTRRLAEALRRAGLMDVTVVRDDTPPPALWPADPDPGDASPFLSPEQARLARTERASHLATGVLTEYAVPERDRDGRAVLRFALATVDGKGRRAEEVPVRVARRAKPEAVAAALALAAGERARAEFAPILAVTPAGEHRGIAGLVSRGLDALEAGDLEEARRQLEQAAREAPRDSRVNAALGDLLLRTGRPAGAISRYRQSLLFDPADASVRRRLLHALDLQGDRVELARAAREAIDAGVGDAETWRFLAEGSLAQGLASEAEAALRVSLDRDPAAGPAIRARALLLAVTGRREEAARLLEPSAREGNRDRAALLARVAALPTDPLAAPGVSLPAPESLTDREDLRRALDLLLTAARGVVAESARPGAADEAGKQRLLAAAARGHALVAWWGRVTPPDLVRELHASGEAALALVARAALAAAVAADRPWPGGAALVARLCREAHAAFERT